ncbi:MAG: ABC transporter ATP-binding protein [Oscillospiraceae bacterium]
MEILRVQDLSFRYPGAERDTLHKLSFEVPSGAFILLCGESGCGKSTLLKLLKRELAPFGEKSGDILYEGVRQQDMDDREAAAGIGFVQQNPENQVVTDQVWHELAFGLESLGYSTPVIRRRVAEMASYFGIQEWFRKSTSALSGGQKQMLSLASVMAMQPKLLLLDEPTSQLDPIAASEFITTLQKLNRELGLTILLAEHRLEELFPIADRVLVLEEGSAAVYDHPENVAARLQGIRRNHACSPPCQAPSAFRGAFGRSALPAHR